MNRFAISCFLGLGCLVLSQSSLAVPITCTVTGNTCSEVPDAPDTISTSAQLIGGTNITSLTGHTGAPDSGNPLDPADFYQFVWQGTTLDINVQFTNIQGYSSAGDTSLTTYGFRVYNSSQSPIPGAFRFNNNTICSKPGRQNTGVAPNNCGLNFDPNVDFVALSTLSLTSAQLISGNTYYLAFTESGAGISTYTATFSTPLNPGGGGNGSAPEPGMPGLLGIGLVAALLNSRRRTTD